MSQPQVTASSNCAIRAVVGNILEQGKFRFAVAYLERGVTLPEIERGEDITFSLSDWQGKYEPQKGQVVLLEHIELFKKGWRARCARPITLQTQDTREKDHEI